MALKLKYNHPRHKVEYPEAYAKLNFVSIDMKDMNVSLGIFPSVSARETLKVRDDLEKKIQSAEIAIQERLEALMGAQGKAETAWQKHEENKKKFNDGQVKEDTLEKSDKELQELAAEAGKLNLEYEKARSIAGQIRAGLDSDPPAEPVDVLRYTFPITEELLTSGNILSVCYNLLKDVEIFKEAEDV